MIRISNIGCPEHKGRRSYSLSPKRIRWLIKRLRKKKRRSLNQRSLLNLPLVGFSFFSTHFPKEIDCRERFAEYLWNRAIQEGYVPIELQFFQSGNQHNIMRRKFNFATNTTRLCKPDASRLISLVKACRGIAFSCYRHLSSWE